jgi:hypothetical protein
MSSFEIPCHSPAKAFFSGFFAQKIPCRDVLPEIGISLIGRFLLVLSRIVSRFGFDFRGNFPGEQGGS